MIIDLKNKILGRTISSNIYNISSGFVTSIVNCDYFRVMKISSKKPHYFYNSRPGSFKSLSFKEIFKNNSVLLVRLCLKRMLKKNITSKKIFSSIKFLKKC